MFRCVFLTIDIFGKSLEFLFFDCCKSPNKLAKRLTSTNKKQLLMFKVDLSDAIGLITVFLLSADYLFCFKRKYTKTRRLLTSASWIKVQMAGMDYPLRPFVILV